jgi:hypothetical protein
MRLRKLVFSAALAAVAGCLLAPESNAQVVLVDESIFTSPYSGWVDVYPDRLNGSNWRLSLHNPTLMETHNANLPNSGGVTDGGNYEPSVLVQDGFVAPDNYTLTANMYTSDDDLFGIVFNYVDADNYYRMGYRAQNAGSFGATRGVSVQKFVNGTMTQIFPASTLGPFVRPIVPVATRQQVEVSVVVNNGTLDILFDGMSLFEQGPVVDDDLTGGGKIGFQSWAQQALTTNAQPHWGTEIESFQVSDANGPLYGETFDQRGVAWRPLNMLNNIGGGPLLAEGGVGNFGIDINQNRILQVSNSYQWATTTGPQAAPNVDFIGAAVVIDEPGSENYANYELRVRMAAGDNDGIGVLLRVQDDDTFYRVNFASEAMGTNGQRPPQGMSFQKSVDGVWTELFRDDQDNPAFVHYSPSGGIGDNTPSAIYDPRDPMDPSDDEEAYIDLIVRAVGNTFQITATGWDIISETYKTHTYDLIVDDDNPLLTGTVGLTSFGNANSFWSAYGGGGHAFLTAIPEPGTVAVGGIAAVGLFLLRRRSR